MKKLDIKSLLNKPPHRKTEKEIKLDKLKLLQRNLQNITKQSSFAYKSAVARNKKKREYENYLMRAKSELNPIKQNEIIQEYISKK